jgi:hypothetical protein
MVNPELPENMEFACPPLPGLEIDYLVYSENIGTGGSAPP